MSEKNLDGQRSSTLDDRIRTLTHYAVPVGRAMFSAIFVFAALGHFGQPAINMAASQGVPLASLAVPLSGVMALVGGLSVLVGYRARLGALLLVAFLLPVTFMMHKFWAVTDPGAAQLQMVMFMKNLGLIGGALLIAHFGAGPVSIDARQETA